jgi:hypothetical protein
MERVETGLDKIYEHNILVSSIILSQKTFIADADFTGMIPLNQFIF